jgi:site-specific DNA recombinase
VSRKYVDNDYSAFSGRTRPGYDQLLEDLRAGLIDAVVAWAPERLHRSPRELEDFLELVERTGARVDTVKAGAWDVSTSHGRLVARMLGAVSRAESERIGERVSRAHRQAKKAGRWRGPIPYGMRASAVPGMPEPDPAQADTVGDIFERVMRGDALTAIARELSARGLKPRRGDRWTHSGVQRLVASPALGGLIDLDGELQPAAFEGVVTPEEWRDAQAAIRRRPRGELRRPREVLSLLGGYLHCAEHDYILFGAGASHAHTYQAALPGQCYVTITRAGADGLVEQLIIERLSRPDAADLLSPAPADDGAQREAAELRRRRDDLIELIGDGLLTAGAAREKLTAIGERLSTLEVPAEPRLMAPASLTDPRAAWAGLTMPQRRAVVRLLFQRITVRHVGSHNGPRVDPTRVEVEWARS